MQGEERASLSRREKCIFPVQLHQATNLLYREKERTSFLLSLSFASEAERRRRRKRRRRRRRKRRRGRKRRRKRRKKKKRRRKRRRRKKRGGGRGGGRRGGGGGVRDNARRTIFFLKIRGSYVKVFKGEERRREGGKLFLFCCGI